jgi:TolA-binding protein
LFRESKTSVSVALIKKEQNDPAYIKDFLPSCPQLLYNVIMRKVSGHVLRVTIFVILLFCLSVQAFAQELLIRKDSFSTEVFLKIPPEQIADIQQAGSAVTVTFNRQMRTPFSQAMNDPFVISIQGQGNSFTITFQNAADFAAVRTTDGVRFIATRPMELDSVLLSYNLEAPILRKQNYATDDPALDAQLREFDTMMQNRQFYMAVNAMNNILATTDNLYYQQEALYRLGTAQMALGPTDIVSYLDAASTYDSFVERYPDNNKVAQARQLAAEAKELGGTMFEAANSYRAVYDNATDAETKRVTLLKIAEIYNGLEQFDNTIAAYEEYLDNFKADQNRIRALLGSLYINRTREDDAYRMFSQVPIDTLKETLSNAEIFALAKIFQSVNDLDKATTLFDYIGTQSIEEAPEALWHLADIYKTREQTENHLRTLKRLMDNFPDTTYGLDALIAHAELTYADQSATDWRAILDPVYQIEDTEGLVPRAEIIQIKALQAVNDVFPLVSKIDEYIATYPEEGINNILLKMKEDALYNKAMEYLQGDNDNDALTLFRQVVAQFPESPRIVEITQHIDDILYNGALALFNNKDYAGTQAAVDSRMQNEPPHANPVSLVAVRWPKLKDEAKYQHAKALYDAANYEGAIAAIEDNMQNPERLEERWPELWEDAKFAYMNTGNLPEWKLRYKAQEYLAYLPNGRYVNEVMPMLVQNFQIPFNTAFSAGDYASVVRLFDENIGWLERWPDQTLANRAKIMVTKALMQMGLRDQAVAMYTKITPTMTSEYAELGYTLCQKNVLYDINKLTVEQFTAVVSEAERCGDAAYTVSLVDKYTVDSQAALSTKYRLAKNISDDRRREQVLADIYSQINSDSSKQFEGYEEVYLDMGLLAYKKNDFAGSLMPLQKYVDTSSDSGDKKAEALYYLGKSLMSMNERDRGLAYFRQIVAMPDTIYKNMANNELEDDAWRRGQ